MKFRISAIPAILRNNTAMEDHQMGYVESELRAWVCLKMLGILWYIPNEIAI